MDNLKELTEYYLFECAVCGYEQAAQPSIGMKLGFNSGHGSCLQCKSFLHLEIGEDGTMTSYEWNEWLEENDD